ncbi:GNAT family N-acetyltransferase [Streptomyces sp. NPDC047070]|uniref:GNAT family N-acetyltransferase n=1 Tax=Streptomyces sp. NPDC047070 TaxID=3154923 RepID=UPI0034554E1E
MTGRSDLTVPHTVHTHLGADALTILARHWPALYAHDRQAPPFQSPGWLGGAVRLLPATATPVVLAAMTAASRIIAALALARHRNRGRIRVEPLSTRPATHTHLIGPHAERDAVAEAFALHLLLLQETGADVMLPGLRADTAFGRAVQAICPDSLTTQASPPAALALPFSFEALAPSRQRAHARRCRHWAQLAATHTITYRRSHHQRALRAGLKVLTALHQAEQARPRGPGTAVPWRAVAPALGAAGAFVADLHIDTIPVAAQLCLTRGHACYSVEQVTHPGYRHVAPGHALLRHLLDDLTQEGFHTLHSGCGPAASAAPGPPIRLAA